MTVDDDAWLVELDAWEATRDRMRGEFVAEAKARFGKDRIVSVESYGDEVRFTSSLTKSARPGVAYQVTDFEGDLPIGHREYDDLEAALEGLWDVSSPRTKGLPPMPNPAPEDPRASKYRYLGTDDEESVCSCCGRQGLKRVAWLEALDEEGNEISVPLPYGTTCAAHLMLGRHPKEKKPTKTDSEKVLMEAWLRSVQEAWDRAKVLTPPEPTFGKTSFGTAMIYVGDVGQPRSIRSYRGEGQEPIYEPVERDLLWLNQDWRKRRATEIGKDMGIVGIHPTTFGHVKNPSGRLRRASARISNP